MLPRAFLTSTMWRHLYCKYDNIPTKEQVEESLPELWEICKPFVTDNNFTFDKFKESCYLGYNKALAMKDMNTNIYFQ